PPRVLRARSGADQARDRGPVHAGVLRRLRPLLPAPDHQARLRHRRRTGAAAGGLAGDAGRGAGGLARIRIADPLPPDPGGGGRGAGLGHAQRRPIHPRGPRRPHGPAGRAAAAVQRPGRGHELRRPAAGAAAVRRPAQRADPLLQRPPLGEAGADRLGPAALSLRGLGGRCAGEAEVRPVLRQEPRPGVRLHDPAADGRGRVVQARRALSAPARGSVPAHNLFQSGLGASSRRRAARALPPRPDIRMASTQELIHEFIVANFPGDKTEPTPEMDLLEAGIIDSIGVLTLVTWLEETFGFVVDDEDVLPENLGSIAGIAAYAERKLDGAGTAA